MRVLVAAIALLAFGAGQVELPDPATGSVDGKVALLLWPQADDRLLDPAGCVVHVAGDWGRGAERRHACGEWFVPGPAGAYLTWLEQGDTISAGTSLVHYGAEPFRGRGAVSLHRMVPAGYVALANEARGGAATLRLFSGQREGSLQPFERRASLNELSAPLRMPEGPLIAALYDAADQPLALARPVRVEAGKRVIVAPRLPSPGGAVLFSLQRSHRSYPAAKLTLEQEGRRSEPDVMQESSARVVAIWYSVPGGEATLRFEGDGLPKSPAKVNVERGKVALLRERL
ncbi:MAG TPA: hypothetical protein VEO54_16130 [Thermoanaerobaculia bacterium]|nr:hypothetical protein [Thermoanaerobaculia bacterium]